MLLNHIAAVLLFSGPFLYLGLWLALDPAGVANIPRFVLRVARNVVQCFSGIPAEQLIEPDDPPLSPRLRRTLRLTGVMFVLLALAA